MGHLYDLRSKLVHGGQIKRNPLRKINASISTVPADIVEPSFGVVLAYAVDRMRDLVRRAILARLCLGAKPDPLWPFTVQTPVDEILSDDAHRAVWRARWHDRLAELRVGDAAEPSSAAVDFLSQDVR